MFVKLREFFWPILSSPCKCELDEISKSIDNDIKSIQDTDWGAEQELALEEARRLYSEEDERRKTAESKASNLLLVAVALIPLLTYLETMIWDGSHGSAPLWLTLPMLALAVAYLGNAGLWAFRTLTVGAYHRVYPADLINIWGGDKNIKLKLIIELMEAVRRNQEPINEKVSATKMTHAFLLRAVLAFSILLIIRIGFGLWCVSKQSILDYVQFYL